MNYKIEELRSRIQTLIELKEELELLALDVEGLENSFPNIDDLEGRISDLEDQFK